MDITNPSDADRPGAAPHRAADDVFRHLAERITSGDLREGDTLPSEREIVEQYGVSRTVVREAVLALANKGLVDARPRFRPVVRKPSFDTAFNTVNDVVTGLLHQAGGVKNLFDTRIMIEAGLARQGAVDAKKPDIAALKEALEANEAVIENNAEFFRTDIAFHAVLYDIPKNPVLPAIHKAYTSWLAPQWTQMPRAPGRNRLNFNHHRAIFEGILMRDPDAAEAALRKHLSDAWDQICETFGEI